MDYEKLTAWLYEFDIPSHEYEGRLYVKSHRSKTGYLTFDLGVADYSFVLSMILTKLEQVLK